MPLLSSGTGLPRARLEEIYREHLEGISGLAKMLDDPDRTVTDPARRMHALDLARDALQVLPESPGSLTEPELLVRANLSYDLMIALIEMAKSSLDLQKVPRAKKT